MAQSEPDQQRSQFEWKFWFQWIAATAFGWLVGWMLLGEIGIGAAIGITQWLVLRGEVSDAKAGWWILVSPGPDCDFDLSLEEIERTYESAGPVTDRVDHGDEILLNLLPYCWDPTNGIYSSGDIIRVKQ